MKKTPILDPVSRLATVEIHFPNPEGRLVSGMFGDLEIVIGRKENVPRIPLSSVQYRATPGERGATSDEAATRDPYVFVVENGRAVRRDVVTGYQQAGQSYIRLEVEMQRGTALDTNEEVIRQVEREIAESIPEIRTMTAIIGNPGTIGGGFQGVGSNFTEFHIGLIPISERSRSQSEITDVIRSRLMKIPGIEYRFRQGGMEFSEGDVIIKIFGYDLNELRELADRVAAKVSTLDGVVDVKSAIQGGQPEWVVDIDRNRAAQMGLKASMVSDVVYTSIQGSIASRYLERGEEHEILVRLPAEYRQRKDILENLLIRTPAGAHIPLKAVADIRQEIAPFTVTREDQQRMASVALSVSGRDLGGVIADVSREMSVFPFPPDTRHEVGGAAEDMQESFLYLGIALLVAFYCRLHGHGVHL